MVRTERERDGRGMEGRVEVERGSGRERDGVRVL
jgi:hypothetical protein